MENVKKRLKINIDPKKKGIICIIISALGFAFMCLFVKLSGDLPAILGMIFLGEFPDIFSIIGYIVIIGAGVAMFLIKKSISS